MRTWVWMAAALAAGGDEALEVVAPFLEQHCLECHSGAEPRAGLDLARFDSRAALRAGRDDLLRVREVLSRDDMPPFERPRPAAADVDALLRVLEETLGLEPLADEGAPLRRLNRTEYRNTVRDLFGVDFPVEDRFPRDPASGGFDNAAASLALPSVLFEKYLLAAEELAAQVICVVDPDDPPVVRVEAEELRSERFDVYRGLRSMYTNGAVGTRLRVDVPGTYRVRIHATAQQAGPDAARMELRVDGERETRFDVEARHPDLEVYAHELELESGEHVFEAVFTNDYYRPEDPDPGERDRNLHVGAIEVAGPVGALVASRFQARLAEDFPAARDAVAELALRTWRRPPTAEELDGLLALSEPGAAWPERVRAALTALLASPHFLFKVELDRGAAALSDWELATRLSYFLWASAPDAALRESCARGELSDPERLRGHVRRMLRDPRAASLAEDFAAQWLGFRTLDEAAPDRERFPEWTESLRDSMREETRRFFDAILREDRPVRELIDADFTFLDAELAEHYGIPGVEGDHVRRVRIPEALRERRGGLLTQAGLLTVTSNPTRTSPVRRGKWVLATLLGAPPPAPPPGVDDLPERGTDGEAASLRERLELHRADPACAVCHDRMDGLGLALENFDAIGRWREHDGPFAIDASFTTTDGRAAIGAAALRAQLAEDDALVASLATALATYALGREPARGERDALRALAASLPHDVTVRELIERIVALEAFRTRSAGSGS